MDWWIAAALVWLGAGLITALVLGQVMRSPAPDLRAQVQRLERQNRELRDAVRLAQALGSSSPARGAGSRAGSAVGQPT